MKKIRVREYWETVTVNKTAVEILDDNDNIIESAVALRVYGEVLDSGDLREYTKEEALEQFRSNEVIDAIDYMQSQIDGELEFEEDCICEQYPEYPGLNQSTIRFTHSKEFSWRLSIYKESTDVVPGYDIELIIRTIKAIENGRFEYSCVMFPNEQTNYVFPELLKKGKKFKVLM